MKDDEVDPTSCIVHDTTEQLPAYILYSGNRQLVKHRFGNAKRPGYTLTYSLMGHFFYSGVPLPYFNTSFRVYGFWLIMQELLISFGLLVSTVNSFIISLEADNKRCYDLELENCFREAFLSAIHPPMLHKRDVFPTNDGINASLGKPIEKKKHVRQIQVCHDVKKFSSCFIYPGCSDQQAANIASVQYHMVFGKKLPMNVFLAYRGYGRALCDQQCSKDVMLSCNKKMNQEEQQEEQGYLLELSSIIGHITPNRDTTVACTRFNKVLVNLIRLRRMHCGESARCTCTDSTVQQGVDGCNSGCEHLLHSNLDEIAVNSRYYHFLLFPNVLFVIFCSNYLKVF